MVARQLEVDALRRGKLAVSRVLWEVSALSRVLTLAERVRWIVRRPTVMLTASKVHLVVHRLCVLS